MCTYFSAHIKGLHSTALHCRQLYLQAQPGLRRKREVHTPWHTIPWGTSLYRLRVPCTVDHRVYTGTTAHNTQTLDDDARDHHTTGHTAMPYSTRRSHHQHTPGRAHSVHNNDSANHDAACSVLLCCAQPSVPTWPGERKQWVLPYGVYGGTRASRSLELNLQARVV